MAAGYFTDDHPVLHLLPGTKDDPPAENAEHTGLLELQSGAAACRAVEL